MFARRVEAQIPADSEPDEPVMKSLNKLSDEPISKGAKAAGFLAKMKTFEC